MYSLFLLLFKQLYDVSVTINMNNDLVLITKAHGLAVGSKERHSTTICFLSCLTPIILNWSRQSLVLLEVSYVLGLKSW